MMQSIEKTEMKSVEMIKTSESMTLEEKSQGGDTKRGVVIMKVRLYHSCHSSFAWCCLRCSYIALHCAYL